MKKFVISTAAAVALLAAPLAGNASAAQQEPVKSNQKVVYYEFTTTNLADFNEWCKVIFDKYDWKKQKEYKKAYKKSNGEKAPAYKLEQKQPKTQPKPVPQQAPAKPNTPAPTPAQPKTEAPAPTQPKTPAPAPAPTQQQANSQLSAFEQQVVDLTNQERSKNGLAPLKVDLALSKVAKEKSRDMAANKYFDHDSPTYGSPFDMMKKFGISYSSAGENIAMGQRTPQEVVKAWMDSPGHRANILNGSFTHIGVGYDANGNYWTQQFIGK